MKSPRHLVQISLLGVTLVLISCGSGTTAPPSQPGIAQPQPSPTPSVTVTIAPGAMGLGPSAFGANPMLIPVGTTVTWINQDTAPHTATSDDGIWDSGLLQPGQSFSFQFTGNGMFNYHCNIHGAASMSGSIQVSGSAAPQPVPPPTPLAPTFTSVRDKILNPHCMSCHEAPSPSAGLDFTNWQNLVHNPVLPTLIVPGNPGASALFVHIASGRSNGGQEAMTPQEQQAIQSWIQSGAPDN
ncbi:MAG: cupredoxin domain-containing protein [Bdellovibrionota bacterium]